MNGLAGSIQALYTPLLMATTATTMTAAPNDALNNGNTHPRHRSRPFNRPSLDINP